jgi:hypothetical protein
VRFYSFWSLHFQPEVFFLLIYPSSILLMLETTSVRMSWFLTWLSPYSSASAGTPSSIFGDKYPNQTFTGWIPAGTPLASDSSIQLLQGKIVKITGVIELYRGKPEIRITSKDQIVSE